MNPAWLHFLQFYLALLAIITVGATAYLIRILSR
jgi:hypothetical protein